MVKYSGMKNVQSISSSPPSSDQRTPYVRTVAEGKGTEPRGRRSSAVGEAGSLKQNGFGIQFKSNTGNDIPINDADCASAL